MYVAPFLRYSTSNNGVPLKYGYGSLTLRIYARSAGLHRIYRPGAIRLQLIVWVYLHSFPRNEFRIKLYTIRWCNTVVQDYSRSSKLKSNRKPFCNFLLDFYCNHRLWDITIYLSKSCVFYHLTHPSFVWSYRKGCFHVN